MPKPRQLTLAVEKFLETPLTDTQAAQLRDYAINHTDLQPEWVKQNLPAEPAPLTYEHALHMMKADLGDMKMILEQDINHIENQLSDKNLHSKVKIFALTHKLTDSQDMVLWINNFTRFTDALPVFLVPAPDDPADQRMSLRSKDKRVRQAEEEAYKRQKRSWLQERNESRENIKPGPAGQTVLRQTIALYDEENSPNLMTGLLKQMDEAFRLVSELPVETDRDPDGPSPRAK